MPAAPRCKSSLLKHLHAAENAIYAVDGQRKIVYVNAAAATWLGIPADELLGQECKYTSSLDGSVVAVVAASLAPPPAAFAGEVCTAEVYPPEPSDLAVPSQAMSPQSNPAIETPQGNGEQTPADAVAVPEPIATPPGMWFRFIPLGLVDGEVDLVLAQSLGPAGAGGKELLPDIQLSASLVPVDPLPEQLHAQLQRMRRRNLRLGHRQRFVGASAAMTRVRAQIAMAAKTQASVLVTGPPGSGRAEVAWAIHAGSQDAQLPLLGVQCADLPTEMVLAEIERCWENGLHAARTLLLNDVDQLSLDAQQQLHRLLVEKPPAFRIVSTARQPLLSAEINGSFHQELALLLSTAVIELPPLAGRLEDLPLLAQALLEEINAHSAKQIGGFKDETIRLLIGYPWPEDVDELTDVIRYAHEHAQSPLIEPRDLPEVIVLANDFAKRPRRTEEPIDLEALLAEIELECIRWAMDKARGNKTQAARLLGMNRPKFYRRLEQLNLDFGPDE